VCFLYKLTHGACPKSYGHNVARLAGLPASIVAKAAVKAAELEAMFRALAQGGGPSLALGSVVGGVGAVKAVDVEALREMQSVIAAASERSHSRMLSIWRQLRSSTVP
jgi:DNA mismatch repair ATPase MutS